MTGRKTVNKKNYLDYAFFNGKFVPTEEAKVSIMTNALQYGTAVFGGMRGYINKREGFLSVFRIRDHFKRLIASLKILGAEIQYSIDDLVKITIDLVRRNNPDTDVYFRPFAYAGSTRLSPNLAAEKDFSFAMYAIPLGDYLPTDKGLRVKISSWRRVKDNAIPARAKISGAYINSALARKEAVDDGYDEAIFLTEDGYVSEGSAENIFIVRDGVLITPPESEAILEGITRKTIIQLAKDEGFDVQIRRVERSELYVADEMFFCGTGVQVAWIKEVDKRIVADGKIGKITKKLQSLYFDIVRGKVKKYLDWCTVVNLKN